MSTGGGVVRDGGIVLFFQARTTSVGGTLSLSLFGVRNSVPPPFHVHNCNKSNFSTMVVALTVSPTMNGPVIWEQT